MASECCQFVGNLDLPVEGCIISINVSSNTETFWLCNQVKLGPTIGSVSVSAIADTELYSGCPSKAGVSILWTRKYDCDTDTVYFINNGEGQSYISGDTAGLATLNSTTGRVYPVISASASSGPTSLYMSIEREDGFGMNYTGGPWEFDTSTKEGVTFNNFGVGTGDLYLQNFDLTLTPGEFPTANYTFAFFISE
jgi:hypothetical protein